MYELSTFCIRRFPASSPRTGGSAELRAHRGGPAVHRTAPQFSASAVRVRRFEPRRDRRVSGQPDPAPRTISARPTRRTWRSNSLADGCRPARVRTASRRSRDRAGRHHRPPRGSGPACGAVRSDRRRAGQQRHRRTSGWRRPRPPARSWAPPGARTSGGRIAGSASTQAIWIRRSTFIRRHQPRVVAVPYWSDRHPDHVAASAVLTEAVFNAGLRAIRPRAPRGSRTGSATTSSTTATAVVCRRRVRALRAEAPRARLPRRASSGAPVTRRRRRAHGSHAPEHAAVPAAHREPRRAVRRARRRHLGRRRRRARTDPALIPAEDTDEHRHRLLRLGRRQRHRRDGAGQDARLARASTSTCSAPTRRSGWATTSPGLSFHRVEAPTLSRCSASRSTCWRWRTRSCRCRARNASTSSTRTMPCRTRRRRIWRARFWRPRNGGSVPKVDHHAARHGHHAARRGSARTRRSSRFSIRAVGRRDGRVRKPQGDDVSRARTDLRHPGHPELRRW